MYIDISYWMYACVYVYLCICFMFVCCDSLTYHKKDAITNYINIYITMSFPSFLWVGEWKNWAYQPYSQIMWTETMHFVILTRIITIIYHSINMQHLIICEFMQSFILYVWYVCGHDVSFMFYFRTDTFHVVKKTVYHIFICRAL